jgi:hypothetical protein
VSNLESVLIDSSKDKFMKYVYEHKTYSLFMMETNVFQLKKKAILIKIDKEAELKK